MKILSVFLIGAISSTIAFRVVCGIALTSPALAADYQPPYNGSPVSAIALNLIGYQSPDSGHKRDAIALTSPLLADDYQPPSNGTLGTDTRESDCTFRGSDRREGCI